MQPNECTAVCYRQVNRALDCLGLTTLSNGYSQTIEDTQEIRTPAVRENMGITDSWAAISV